MRNGHHQRYCFAFFGPYCPSVQLWYGHPHSCLGFVNPSLGLISVVLVNYLKFEGHDEIRIGALFTMTLLGDLVMTFILTTHADSFGRRKTLIIGE